MRIGIRPRARCRACIPLLLASIPLASAADSGQGLRRIFAEEPHLGAVVRIDAYVSETASPPRAFRTAFDRVADLVRTFSSYRDDSEVRQLETAAWRGPALVSQDLFRVLGHSLKLARETGGAFDPTVGRVTRLIRATGWGRQGPELAALQSAWETTGWQHVELDPATRTVFLRRKGMQFDFGGVAKGYIADEALRALADAGIRCALVSVAGDIVAGEPPPGQAGWLVAVDAAGERGIPEREMLLRGQAVSTSGSRERYYLAEDAPCSHVVARGAKDCNTANAAVSVVAPTGLEADSLATALLALGRDAGSELLASRPKVRAFWTPE